MPSLKLTVLLSSLLFVGAFASPLTAQNESRPTTLPATTVAIPKNPEKVKTALARFQERNAKKRSMSADMDMNMSMMGMEIKGSGTILTNADGRSRTELNMNVPMFQGTIKTTMLNDGKNVWQITDMPEGFPGPKGPQIFKGTKEESDAMTKKQGGAGMPGTGSDDMVGQIDNLKKEYDFDTMEDSVTIDNKQYWAISGERRKDVPAGPPNPMTGMIKRVRALFTADTDLFSGVEMLDGGGKKIMVMYMKNFNLEPKFDEKAFAYTPPEGAKVLSFADAMRGAGMGDEDEEDEDEEDAPAPPASKPAGK
ncbi:MAG: LolA family protein [Planctomycetota bacterium]